MDTEKIFTDNSDKLKLNTYKEIFTWIAEKYCEYTPEFVMGCSFGADLGTWRMILSCIYNDKGDNIFKKEEYFEKAILIRDEVYTSDSDVSSPKEEYINGNLRISTYKDGKGCLHSKFVVIKYAREQEEDKYVLVVMSKNISFSNNEDYFVILESKLNKLKPEDSDGKKSDGEKLYDYISNLMDNTQSELIDKAEDITEDITDIFNNLINYDFILVDNEEVNASLYFKYPDSNDSGMLSDDFDDMLNSSIVISPYVTQDYFIKWIKRIKRIKQIEQIAPTKCKLLSYYNQLHELKKKLNESKEEDADTSEWFVGNNNYRFHSKIYARKGVDGKTILYTGSMNLTTNAFENNYEIMVRLEGPEDWYDNLEKDIFCDKFVIRFEDKSGEEIDDNEDEKVADNRQYAVAFNEEKGTYRYYSYIKKENDLQIVSLKLENTVDDVEETKQLFSYLMTVEGQIIIMKSNYLEINENDLGNYKIPNDYKLLNYDEYCDKYQKIKEEIKEIAFKEHDNEILMGRRRKTDHIGINGRQSNNGNRYSSEENPCLYRTIHMYLRNNLNAVTKEEKPNKEKEILLKSLKELRNDLCTKEYKEFVERLIDGIENADEKN